MNPKTLLSVSVGKWNLLGKLVSIRLFTIAAGITTTFFVTTSLAVFSDVDSNSGNGFEVGTLALDLDATSALFNVTNMVPGDVVYAPLTLTNSGGIDLDFTMSTTATNTDNKSLAASLTGEVRQIAGTTCNSTTFATSPLWALPVTGLAALSSPAPQSLTVGMSQTLCFKISLPLSAANALQGSSTDATFTFDSMQA